MSLSRRKFLIGTGIIGGGLIIGLNMGGKPPFPHTRPDSFEPNAWLQIAPDGRVIFQLHKVEMGQGVMTSIPTLLGEELDYDPARFEIEMAGIHPDFNDPLNMSQMTGGSTSVTGAWAPLREAGAIARAMLIAAAASRWNISVDQCTTDNGSVINKTNQQRLSYGALAEAARQIGEVPYALKAPTEYRWIGKSLPRLDSEAKSTGKAVFGMDTVIDGMKIAVVVRSPYFGGSIQSWDVNSVINKPGIHSAVEIHSGIAIVADTYWQARKAANGLSIEWDKGPLAELDSATIRRQQQQALNEEEPYIAKEKGDINSSWSTPGQVLKAEYASPFTHHSPMEPQNATARVNNNTCEIWAPNQGPDICRAIAAHFTGIPQDNITVHTTLLGGGFGRRSYADFVGEAAAVAQTLPGTPIKLIWSREDDMQHDYYRPATYHGLQAALDEQGKLIGWQHNIVASSIIQGLSVNLMSAVLPTWVPTSVARSLGRVIGDNAAKFDPTTADGARLPYQIDNVSIGQILYDSGVPTGFWRSVGFSHNCFVAESFMDEVATAAGADPLTFRLQYLDESPRARHVLELAAEKANWGNPAPGLSQGLAVTEPFSSFCAMVVEVSVKDSAYTIQRVVAAVDCGLAVNPEIIQAQVESAIIYGLSAATKDPVTIKNGAVVESNFHDLPVVRMNEIPKMEIHIVDSQAHPTGIGEIGVPATAPALANALFAATGQRLREMPLRLS